MPKIILLGDSIRLGYAPKVIELLGDGYEVWHPEDNCRFAQYTLRGLFDWRSHFDGADIIHWNNGLWDMCDLFDGQPFTPKQVYADTLRRIAGILQSRAKQVIFATTTPVNPANPHDHNEVIAEYNAYVTPMLESMGVRINDLHAVVAPHIDEYICDDLLHHTEAGKLACAKAVVRAIQAAEKLL